MQVSAWSTEAPVRVGEAEEVVEEGLGMARCGRRQPGGRVRDARVTDMVEDTDEVYGNGANGDAEAGALRMPLTFSTLTVSTSS